MSGETKWTPGPWVVSDSQDEVSVCMGTAIDSPYEYTCGHVWQAPDVYWSEADKEDIANAQLISAAPDLYAALEEARGTIQALVDEGYTGHVDQRGRIDAALAKARGESQ